MSRESLNGTHSPGDQQRLTELLMAISLATDLGTGQQMGYTLRSCLLAVNLARKMGRSANETRTVLQVSLLQLVGCTVDSAETARLTGGDDRALVAAMTPVALDSDGEKLKAFFQHVGAGHSRLSRARMMLHALADPTGMGRSLTMHCEAASMLARRLGLDKSVVQALSHGHERWDGKGFPSGLRGDAIPEAVRIAVVAYDAVQFRAMGQDLSEVLRARAGYGHDPNVVDALLSEGVESLLETSAGDEWNAVLECEPEPHAVIRSSELVNALGVFGDFADLKSPWTRGHSPAVADLAAQAGALCGNSLDEQEKLRHAGLVHDIGRVGVENGIWDKPGRLTIEEWERVRLHPYFTHRILTRCGALAPLADMAASHHERLDGSGYHRALHADQLSMPARILAAADVFVAACSERPYRPPMTHLAAGDLLLEEARAGRLDREAVGAVLSAAGVKRAERRPRWPADLTDREVDVLQLIARGWTNREVADQLHISPKTVGRHIEHIYAKADIKTRAGAAVFAMEHRLLG